MNRFQLFLDTHDPELFKKATSELGTMFYRQLDGDNVKQPAKFEIVYFSGSRIARFIGTLNNDLTKLCQACGFLVDTIELDEMAGTVKITQKVTQ